MTQKEISKIERYFTCYSTSKLYNYRFHEQKSARFMLHKECEFKLIIFEEDNSVYQAGSEDDIIGVELMTFEELIIRFESFTREKINNLTECEDED